MPRAASLELAELDSVDTQKTFVALALCPIKAWAGVPRPRPYRGSGKVNVADVKEVKSRTVARPTHPTHHQAGHARGHSHHPHAGRDVQRVDGDAAEEAGDGAGWRARDKGRN